MRSKTAFDEVYTFLTDDEKYVLMILNEMKEIVNEYRVQAVTYLLKKFYGIPISFRFSLGANPSSEELLYTLTRMRYDYFGLGRKLLKVVPINSDPDTGMVRDAKYSVTNFGRGFVKYVYHEDQRFKNFKGIVIFFRKKVLENGYMENIHRYASWVFIKEELSKTKPEPMVRFYCIQHDYNEGHVATFYKVMKNL